MKTTDEHHLMEGIKKAINEDEVLQNDIRAFRYGRMISLGKKGDIYARAYGVYVKLDESAVLVMHGKSEINRFYISDPAFSLENVAKFIRTKLGLRT